MGKWLHFTDDEGFGLDVDLMDKLDLARDKAAIPFIKTRGLSTQAENDALPESVKDSSHITGHAVDLACADSVSRYKMLTALLSVGFNRIGIYSAHIHVDNDATKPPFVIWYVKGT